MNKGKKTSSFKIRPLLSSLFLIALVGFVVWIVSVKPWSDNPSPQEQQTSSSYTYFTVEERKHIDSLLREMQPLPLPNYDLEQTDYFEGRELMVDERATFSNENADNFYETWEQYLKQDSLLPPEACKQESKKITKDSLPKGFKKLSDKKNGNSAFFLNESDYSIQIIVFSEKNNNAYYTELKKNEEIEFRMAIGEYIGVVSGKNAIPYSDNGIVYCESDNTTIATLLTTYRLKPNNLHNYKFLVSGTNISDFQVIDLFGILETN